MIWFITRNFSNYKSHRNITFTLSPCYFAKNEFSSHFLILSRCYFVGTANAASYSVSIRKYRYCYAAAAARRGRGHRNERYVHGASYCGQGGSRGGNVQRVRANSGLHRHAKQNVSVLDSATRVPHLGWREPLWTRLSLSLLYLCTSFASLVHISHILFYIFC